MIESLVCVVSWLFSWLGVWGSWGRRGGSIILRSFAQWSRASLALLSKTSGEMNGLARIRGEFGWSLEQEEGLLVLWE